jgi:outer membrane protein TolC
MFLSQVKFETGTSAKTDFLQARVDYNARQSDSLAQEAALVRAFADLNALMAEAPERSYEVDDSLALNLSLQPSQPDVINASPLVDIARRQSEISRLDYKIAQSARLPFLSVNGGYTYSRTSNQAGLLLFNQSVGPSAGVGLSIPLYQGGNVRRTIAIARLEAVRNELLFARQSTESARQYRSAWADYTAAVAAYRLERENIGYARENLDIQKARFRLGVATTLETREAESSYVQALVRLYTAAYNVKVQEVRVLEIEGQLVR